MDTEILDFEETEKPLDVPLEELSPASRIRLNMWVKKGLHQDLVDIAEAEDMKVVAVARRALIKFVRAYKESGKY
jgi:hypothetical protein